MRQIPAPHHGQEWHRLLELPKDISFFSLFNGIGTPRSLQSFSRITFNLCQPITRGQSVCFHKNHTVTLLVIFLVVLLCVLKLGVGVLTVLPKQISNSSDQVVSLHPHLSLPSSWKGGVTEPSYHRIVFTKT